MREFGHVKAILNEELLLVFSEESLERGEVITVFAKVSDPRLVEFAGVGTIGYPKGELRVVCSEDKNVYLVERFRQVTERRRTIRIPHPLQKGLLGLAALLQPETKEVVEEVPGPWSAEVDLAAALGIRFEKMVRVGDPVGRV